MLGAIGGLAGFWCVVCLVRFRVQVVCGLALFGGAALAAGKSLSCWLQAAVFAVVVVCSVC